MASPADALHLQLVFRRLNTVRRAAVNGQQKQQAQLAQYRVTAALVSNGWRIPEIADALGVSRHKVRYWKECGQRLTSIGLSLPFPTWESQAERHPGRVTVAEVASYLRVDPATVRRWIKDGDLAATRVSTAEHAAWLIEAGLLSELGIENGTETVQEVAQREGVHPITVREWIRNGQLAAVSFRAGGLLRIPTGARPAHRTD